MNIKNNNIIVFLLPLALMSCASPSSTSENLAEEQNTTNFKVNSSYLSNSEKSKKLENPVSENQYQIQSENPKTTSAAMQSLQALPRTNVNLSQQQQLSSVFSDIPSLTISVNEMAIEDFLHYTFGELLSVNYVIDKDLKTKKENVTLNIKEKISQRRLMQLTIDLLEQYELDIQFNEGLYFIHKVKKSKKGRNVVTGVGRELSSVPNTSLDILQIVPLTFGVKISIEKTLRQLVGVQISTDSDQSALFLQGKREDILRSLEFIHLLDAPTNRGKHIGLISLTYIESNEFTKQITSLLDVEGIPIATNQAGNKNLVMVPIAQVGAIAIFAADKMLLNRVRYWTKIIDKPLQSISKQYFMYHPQYARASDLGDSLSALLSGTQTSSSSQSSKSKSSTGSAPASSRNIGMSNNEITLVVDERANAIIFYTSGSEYQALLPLINKLDVLPRQVLLDITIAEVNLSDEFKNGVEWAFNQGDLAMGTAGSFGVTGIGGFGLTLGGTDGSFNANFVETNDLIKVLSNPTLLVRDGVSASINVGSDISVLGQTTSDPDGQRETTSSEYRKTGVDITVTPSINAQGIVIMEIEQNISNEVPDSTGSGGNPDIFERSLSTEVVAKSGQTIILGGLISENINKGNQKTPWMADIPIIGGLFKAKSDTSNRTELIMLITPKVIDRTDQWDDLTESFKQNLNYLDF